jgi:hypothetical protein
MSRLLYGKQHAIYCTNITVDHANSLQFIATTPGHRKVAFGEEIVITNPNLAMSPHGTVYFGSMSATSRSPAKNIKNQKKAAEKDVSPPSQPG